MNADANPFTASEWPWSESLDAMQATKNHHKVLLENDQVRVLEAWVAPGDTVPVHTHRWPGVIHVVSSSHFVRRDANGTVLVDSRRGDASLQKGCCSLGSGASAPLAGECRRA